MDKDKTKNTETSNPKTITAIKQIKLHKKLKQNLAQPHYMSPIKNKIALSKLKTKQVNSSKEIPSSSPQLLRSITPNMKRNRDVINCNNTKKVMNTTNSNYKSRSLTPIRGVSNPNGKTNNGMNVDNGMSGLKNNHKELAMILALKKKIELEDRKRNQTIDGVSGISMEKINVRQDSICLDLRSQLVDVQLQIKELEFAIKPTKILTSEQATTNLDQGLSAIPAIIGSIPAKPNKPKRKSNSK